MATAVEELVAKRKPFLFDKYVESAESSKIRIEAYLSER
jgi:hypothetical protein